MGSSQCCSRGYYALIPKPWHPNRKKSANASPRGQTFSARIFDTPPLLPTIRVLRGYQLECPLRAKSGHRRRDIFKAVCKAWPGGHRLQDRCKTSTGTVKCSTIGHNCKGYCDKCGTKGSEKLSIQDLLAPTNQSQCSANLGRRILHMSSCLAR
jgi:hypothetical protein